MRYLSRPTLAKTKRNSSPRLGVWLFGAYGGLATTVVVGARALARGLVPPSGLSTATDLVDGIELQSLDGMVFGGHEVRAGDYRSSAREIHAATGTLPSELIDRLKSDLAAAGKNVVSGAMPNAGKTIEELADAKVRNAGGSLRDHLDRIEADLVAFQKKHRLDRVVCVNLTSTEPPLKLGAAHRSTAALLKAIDKNDRKAVRPSTLYALAAARRGMPLIHFTPSNATLVPAVQEAFAASGTPFMGCDGKTGETLVKSALAPMFRYRNLRVLSWQGYNILGDRDGRVLAADENKASKVATKDGLLPQILGYPLHTHVGIDYVPSLHDLKTAWDFIHFEGFLGFRMAMQFTWQGCDAILAAPLVLDMVRFADLAARRGESGPMHHLACFFKQPFEGREHNLHEQWRALAAYCDKVRAEAK